MRERFKRDGEAVRVALIGCGEHSKSSHAAPLARYTVEHPGEIDLVAACDLDLERAAGFCRNFGFARAYADVEEMLSVERVDGCVCVMPMDGIVPLGVKLLERRMPCVIEKPLGTSLAEAEHLAQVARESGTPHMVSVNRRFLPYINRARDWAMAAGPLQFVRATQVRHSRNEPDFIWSTAIHALDALRYIAGEITHFETQIHRQPGLSALWYVISVRFESGACGCIEVLPTAGMVEECYELFGEAFRVRVITGSGIQRSLQCWRSNQLELDEHSSSAEPEDLRNGGYYEVVEFVQALKTGKALWPTIEDIIPSARICFSIAEAVARQTASHS